MLNYSSAVILALLDHIDARDAEIKSLLDDLRRYADPHDLSDPQNPRHVSVGLMGVRLRAMLGETPQ